MYFFEYFINIYSLFTCGNVKDDNELMDTLNEYGEFFGL